MVGVGGWRGAKQASRGGEAISGNSILRLELSLLVKGNGGHGALPNGPSITFAQGGGGGGAFSGRPPRELMTRPLIYAATDGK